MDGLHLNVWTQYSWAPTIGGLQIGVKLDDKGGVVVDDFSRSVSVPSVWAVGDVTNRIPLTPVARMEGLLLAQHIFKCAPICYMCTLFGSPQSLFEGP